MHAENISNIKKRLVELRKQLEAVADTGEASAKVVELDQSRVGRLSRMDALQAQALAQASGRRRVQLKINIEAALKRIDDGEYGDCVDCGEPIDPRRLDFDPTARRCIGCAEKAES